MFHTEYVEWNENKKMTSGPKGMGDIYRIIDDIGGTPLVIPSHRTKMNIGVGERIGLQKQIYKTWVDKCSVLKEGDWFLIDIPVLERFIYFRKIVSILKRRGVKLAVFIADLEIVTRVKYRKAGGLKSYLIRKDEKYILDNVDMILTHNDAYESKLRELGVGCNIYKFEIFDYLAPSFRPDVARTKRISRKEPIIIAANLDPAKAGYVDKLPEGCRFNLYGTNYKGTPSENVCYKGAFPPEELMEIMEGSFGLVWDGDSCDTCSGNYGEYLRYNIPHKTSLYLASGIPVIIWKEAAMAKFVTENKCGITVDSISEIESAISYMSDEEYQDLVRNAEVVGERLRDGYYTKRIMHEAFGL